MYWENGCLDLLCNDRHVIPPLCVSASEKWDNNTYLTGSLRKFNIIMYVLIDAYNGISIGRAQYRAAFIVNIVIILLLFVRRI